MDNTFSRNLRKIRKDNNLSQEQLALELGVSRQAISKWESALAYPEMDKIITLCDKFNLNIDDLLHKDIREVKGEEESKKKLNKYVDDFLSFVTNTVDMFSHMSFKSKCKCLFEQFFIGFILFVIFMLIAIFGENLISSLFGFLPFKVYSVLYSIAYFIYGVFCVISFAVILVHIFKIRYLDYYKNNIPERDSFSLNKKVISEKDSIDNERIVIRDPNHSEYKFINGLLKGSLVIIKFFVLCFSLFLFVSLIGLFIAFIICFLIAKTGLLFIGLLIVILSLAVINIILVLLSLNFVFSRKNDKKRMICSFIISLITCGIGSGLIFVGMLNFKYVESDESILKTDYIEFDMKKDFIFETYPKVEYIESNNKNIKLEYTINRYCNINGFNSSDSLIHVWAYCDDPIKMVNEYIRGFNDKKIFSINNEIKDLKIYTTKENIEILKKNYSNYVNAQIQVNNIISSYEEKVAELQNQINKYERELQYNLYD